MILLEEFVYAEYCGRSIYYTSRSFANDLWMIDWAHYTDPTKTRDRNHWRKIVLDD